MFSPNPKNDPLLSAIKGVIAENDKHREAVDRANKHFKITDKRQLPHDLHSQYDKMINESNLNEKITKSTPMGKVIADFEKSDAPQFEGKSKEKRRQMAIAAKMAMNEALKGNQHKIDANKNNRIDAEDFKMLRNKDMTAEDVMREAISNISEKSELSEAENNILMELDVSDTEVMNSDLYKNALKSVNDPRRIQIGQEVEGLGKFEKGDTIFSKVRAQLAAQKAAPVPMAKMDNKQPLAQSVPPRGLSISQIGQEADNARLSGYREIQQSGPSTGPVNNQQPVAMNTNASGTLGIGSSVNSQQKVSSPFSVRQSVPGATPALGPTPLAPRKLTPMDQQNQDQEYNDRLAQADVDEVSRRTQMGDVIRNTDFSGNNTGMNNPLAGALDKFVQKLRR